jgi:hypothetical protein
MCTLSAIVTTLSPNTADPALSWVVILVDQLIDMLGNGNLDIRSAASNMIVQLSSKIPALCEMIIGKLFALLKKALDKRSETMQDYTGHIVTISLLGNSCQDEKLKVMVFLSLENICFFVFWKIFICMTFCSCRSKHCSWRAFLVLNAL